MMQMGTVNHQILTLWVGGQPEQPTQSISIWWPKTTQVFGGQGAGVNVKDFPLAVKEIPAPLNQWDKVQM